MPEKFILFATPGWVNLLFLTPFVAFYLWRGRLNLSNKKLLMLGIFAAAFGFVEAAVVVYLRALAGFPDGVVGASLISPTQILPGLSASIVRVEIFREAATMIMLFSVATLAVRRAIDRFAAFFWMFAIWDIFYYVWLYVATGWPPALTTPDVLFLIPAPWISQVWFPVIVSLLFVAVVILGKGKKDRN